MEWNPNQEPNDESPSLEACLFSCILDLGSHWMSDALRRWHDQTPDNIELYVEYKPFEPAFYHTDIGDWGMASLLCKRAGPRAKVLVDPSRREGTLP